MTQDNCRGQNDPGREWRCDREKPFKSRTAQLAHFAAQLPQTEIPTEVTGRALDLLIDLIGSAVRAAKDAESTPSILRMTQRLGLSGDPQCTVFGLDRRYGGAAAALLNGAFGHSLDFDDTHADSSLHPSAPVVSAAVAAAEMTHASGPELLGAIVVGYEVCCRLGNALDPAAHYARGFHPTATAGVFGACAAVGRLLKLDERDLASAFGIAASQASGSLQFLANGAWNKRYQVGEAAMKGMIAATLASEGFQGAVDGIDGKHGFLSGYSDAAHPDLLTAALGQVWETMRIGVKPYPACRYTHAAVDGLLELTRSKHIIPGGYSIDHRRAASQRDDAGRRTSGGEAAAVQYRARAVLHAVCSGRRLAPRPVRLG